MSQRKGILGSWSIFQPTKDHVDLFMNLCLYRLDALMKIVENGLAGTSAPLVQALGESLQVLFGGFG